MSTREDILSLAETEARAECARRGIDPDELCADGGITAWMVVDQERRHFAAPTPPAAEAPGQEPVADIGLLAVMKSVTDRVHASPEMKLLRSVLYRDPPTYADAEAKGFERGIEAAAKWLDDNQPATQDMYSTDIADRLSEYAAAIRSLASPAPKGET